MYEVSYFMMYYKVTGMLIPKEQSQDKIE